MSASRAASSRGVSWGAHMSQGRRRREGTCLAGDRVYELCKGDPGRDFELHDVDADVVGGRAEIARAKGHRDDALVVGDIESEGRIEARGGL